MRHGGPGLESSLLVAAHRKGIPLTVHVAIGTDIVHMTPRLDGAALGRAALDDFRDLCRTVAEMAGGVWLNLGSAVVLPEVFLKAVAIARNLGVLARRPDDRQSRLPPAVPRPAQRPPAAGGRGDRVDGPSRADDPTAPRGGRRADRCGDDARQAPPVVAASGRFARAPPPDLAMTIAVVCPNLVGDTVMATPTFRAIRAGFRSERIVAVVRPGVAPVLDGGPWFDDRILCDHRAKNPTAPSSRRRREAPRRARRDGRPDAEFVPHRPGSPGGPVRGAGSATHAAADRCS